MPRGVRKVAVVVWMLHAVSVISEYLLHSFHDGFDCQNRVRAGP